MKRGLETSTTRADDRDLINDDARGVDCRWASKGRLQHEFAFGAKQIDCDSKTERGAGSFDDDVELFLTFRGFVGRCGFDAAARSDLQFFRMLADEQCRRAGECDDLRREQPEFAVADYRDAISLLDRGTFENPARSSEWLSEHSVLVANVFRNRDQIDSRQLQK